MFVPSDQEAGIFAKVAGPIQLIPPDTKQTRQSGFKTFYLHIKKIVHSNN